jgi:hypothetical protein
MIKSKGYEPVLGEHLYTKFSNGYNYAGTEQERIKDINWALNDKEICNLGFKRRLWLSASHSASESEKLYEKSEMVYRIF